MASTRVGRGFQRDQVTGCRSVRDGVEPAATANLRLRSVAVVSPPAVQGVVRVSRQALDGAGAERAAAVVDADEADAALGGPVVPEAVARAGASGDQQHFGVPRGD